MEDQNAESPKATTMSVGIRYGLISAVVSIAYFVGMDVAGVDMTQGIGRWASLLFSLAIIYLAHKYYKENGDGYMSIGQGTGIGFWMSLVSSVISSAFTFVYVSFINTGYIEQMLDKTRENMAASGDMSEEQLDQAMEMTAKFMTPTMMVIFGIVFGIIILVICALIVSLFTKKNNPDIEV